MVKQVRRSVSLGSATPPILRVGAPALYNNFGTLYVRTHSMRNRNQILHGDQTRCEEIIFRVDHE